MQTFLSHVPSCHNVATLNSSVPDCRWSQWRSRRWCDTWDPDRGLQEPLQPHSLTLTSASLLWDWYFSRTRGHLHQILSPGLKNRQFRQHFSTGRYCSVGEGASVADVEGKCTTIIFRDEIEFIARTHCRATSAHQEKLGRRCELCIDTTPMQLLSHWYEHKLSTFQLAAVASSWGIVGRKILQKGRTGDALGGREVG